MTTAQSLPEWNLKDLYAGPQAPELEADLENAKILSAALQTSYQDRLMELNGAGLATA